jgi:hypothetical protein
MTSLVSKLHNHLLSKQIFITCKSCHFFLIFVHICSSLGETWPCRSHGYLCDLVRSRKDGCCRTIKRIQLCTTWHVASSPVVRPYCIWYAQEVAWFTQAGHLHHGIIQVCCIVASASKQHSICPMGRPLLDWSVIQQMYGTWKYSFETCDGSLRPE